MPVFIGVEIGNQPRYQDSAEKGKGNTQHLSGCETQYRSETEIGEDGGSQERGYVGIQYRGERTAVAVIDSQLVTLTPASVLP